MKVKRFPLACLLVILFTVSVGADTLRFAKNSLRIDFPLNFGAPLSEFTGIEKMDGGNPALHSDNNWEWYKTEETAAFEQANPGRQLRFGFKKGRLQAIQFFSGMNFLGKDKKQAQEELSLIFADFKKLAGEKLSYQDRNLRIEYNPYCSPSENLFAVIVLSSPTGVLF